MAQGERRTLTAMGAASAAALATGATLVVLAPLDADQGVVQKIFYVHVPLAITALCGFVAGALLAYAYLRTGDDAWDLRSYVAIHLSLVAAVPALATGSIWAHAAWGHWWVWDEPALVSFLVVVLLYACYQPLRFAIADPERQRRYASVFAILAGAFVPLNFVAVRLAQAYTHPRVLTVAGGHMPGSMRAAFLVCLLAAALTFVTLWRLEVVAKRSARRLARARRARDRDRDDAVLLGAPAPAASAALTVEGAR